MKKIVLLVTSLMFAAGILCAQQNDQKVWDVDSQVYKDMVSLYLFEGRALPSSVGPWSTDELKCMLDVFDGNFNSDSSNMLYDKIHAELYKKNRIQFADGFAADFEASFIPELYVHTNSDDFIQEEDWNYDYTKRDFPLNFDYELFATKNIYLRSGFNVGLEDGHRNAGAANVLYQPKFSMNIPMIAPGGIDYINFNFPETAFASFGGEHWNVLLGRDVIRWGNGESGNLYYGGNQVYSNAVKLTTYFNKFKYTFVTDFSAHEMNALQTGSQFNKESGTRFFMTHRFDFRFFNDRLNFSVAEGYVYQSADNTFDVRYFNPMMFYHNQYIRANSNSILGFDADYAICRGLNVYGQFVIDEFSMVGEPTTESDGGGRPNKMGALLGVKYAMPLMDGVLRFNLEGVYTDPYLYLREQYANGENGVSLYSYVREFHNTNPTVTYTRKCIGYKYGGDCVVGDFKANYATSKNWISEFELFYMAHGIICKDFGGDDWAIGKSKAPSTHDIAETPVHEDGFVEHTFRVSLSSSYPILKWLTVSGGIDNYFIWNQDNVQKPMVYDMQLHAGVKIYY